MLYSEYGKSIFQCRIDDGIDFMHTKLRIGVEVWKRSEAERVREEKENGPSLITHTERVDGKLNIPTKTKKTEANID